MAHPLKEDIPSTPGAGPNPSQPRPFVDLNLFNEEHLFIELLVLNQGVGGSGFYRLQQQSCPFLGKGVEDGDSFRIRFAGYFPGYPSQLGGRN